MGEPPEEVAVSVTMAQKNSVLRGASSESSPSPRLGVGVGVAVWIVASQTSLYSNVLFGFGSEKLQSVIHIVVSLVTFTAQDTTGFRRCRRWHFSGSEGQQAGGLPTAGWDLEAALR